MSEQSTETCLNYLHMKRVASIKTFIASQMKQNKQ